MKELTLSEQETWMTVIEIMDLAGHSRYRVVQIDLSSVRYHDGPGIGSEIECGKTGAGRITRYATVTIRNRSSDDQIWWINLNLEGSRVQIEEEKYISHWNSAHRATLIDVTGSTHTDYKFNPEENAWELDVDHAQATRWSRWWQSILSLRL